MAITELPASPAGEITHGQVRSKINEVVVAANNLEQQTVVRVRSDGDLPAILAANTSYEIESGVTITKNVTNNGNTGCRITGPNGVFSTFSFAGTGTFITMAGSSLQIDNVMITAPAGTKFIDGTGDGVNTTLVMQRVQMSGGAKLGSLDGVTPAVRDFIAIGHEDGFDFASGAYRGLTFNNCFIVDSSASSVNFDFGSAVFSDLKMNEVTCLGAGTSISSSVSGVNVAEGKEAFITKCTLDTATVFSGFSDDFQTNRWRFESNDPITKTEDTRYVCDQYLVTATPNVISVSTPGEFYTLGVPTVGVWQSDVAKHYQPNANGSVTYTGEKPIDVKIFYTASISKVGGGSNELETRLSINHAPLGTGIEKSRAITQNNNPTSVSGVAQVTHSPGDVTEVIFANNDGTSDINVYNVNYIIEY